MSNILEITVTCFNDINVPIGEFSETIFIYNEEVHLNPTMAFYWE